MTDFTSFPLDKLMNRENYFSRVERLERGQGAKPSAVTGNLSSIAQQTGNIVVDGSIVVPNRDDGQADITINDLGIFVRNQEGLIGFQSLTGTADDNVGIYIASDDHLVIKNAVGDKSIRFHIDDASHNVIQYYFDASGLHLGNSGVQTLYLGGGYAIENGWYPTTDTVTRTGTHSFTVPNDRSTVFRPGTKFSYTDAAVQEFGVVGSVTYVSTDTATTINLISNSDYSMSTDTIATPLVSYIENPLGFPSRFNWSANPAGFSVQPSSPSYWWTTHLCTITLYYIEPNNGTSNATSFSATAPIAPAHNVAIPLGTAVDNGTVLTAAARVVIAGASTTMTFQSNMGTGAWTNANGKRAVVILTYNF